MYRGPGLICTLVQEHVCPFRLGGEYGGIDGEFC